jgi:GntR family transcriptional regulator
MMTSFNETQPIFVQIRQRIAAMILSESAKEGEALPSVRSIVTRAYDALVDLGVVESRRGMGMFVATGGRDKLMAHERETFLNEEWPRIRTQIEALGLDLNTLLKGEQK